MQPPMDGEQDFWPRPRELEANKVTRGRQGQGGYAPLGSASGKCPLGNAHQVVPGGVGPLPMGRSHCDSAFDPRMGGGMIGGGASCYSALYPCRENEWGP